MISPWILLSRPSKRHLVRLSMACCFFVFVLFCGGTTAWGQSDVKSLDELMAEVDEEAPPTAEAAEDGDTKSGTGVPPSAGGIQSLEDMMEEIDEEGVVEVPEVDGVQVGEGEEQGLGAQSIDEGGAESESNGASGWFWFGIVAIIVSLILLGTPLYVLIGTLTMYLLLAGGIFDDFRYLTSIIEQTRSLADKEVLLAIPFFVISGALMTEGDIARRLIEFAESLFGKFDGGLAIATVFACAFFAAISGSSPVTVIAIGSIMYPALMKAGYPDRFSTGIVTSMGSLGILIPPSIPMIVYAIVDPSGLKDPAGYHISGPGGGGDSSVNDLFIAGIGPGLLIGLAVAFYAFRIGAKNKILTTPFDSKRLLRAFRQGFWALFLPVLILGGIYTGIFTPTPAAAVAVVYALVVEFFIHRSLNIKDLPRIFTESVVLMGSLLIIIAVAMGFNMYLERAKIPDAAVDLMLSMDLSFITFLLMVNVLLLIVGFFMDILSAILILVPLLSPIGFELGIHPIHLAIVFIVNLEIGYLTPPIGLNLFVSSTLFKKGIGDVVKSVLPFMGIMLVCLIAVTYVPTLSLGLVSLSRGGGFYVPFPEVAEEVQTSPEGLPATGSNTKGSEAGAGGPPADTSASPGGVQSLEDMMDEVETDNEATEDTKDAEEPGEVKSLEELMREVDEE